MKKLFIVTAAALLLTACNKNTENALPVIESIQTSSDFVRAGETIELLASVTDSDEDSLIYLWDASKGTLIPNLESGKVSWKAPEEEGTYEVEFFANDNNVKVSKKVSIDVNGYLYDCFDSVNSDWEVSNGIVSNENGSVKLALGSGTSDAENVKELKERVLPPYDVYLTTGLAANSTDFASSDKYGLLLDFYNVSADTMVKGLWFRIYPTSSTKNWKLSVYKDLGTSNGWINAEETGYSLSDAISVVKGETNQLKISIDEQLKCSLYSGSDLVFQTTALADSFAVNGVLPKLELQKVGVRSSIGTVIMDDVFVTQKTSLTRQQIFGE